MVSICSLVVRDFSPNQGVQQCTEVSVDDWATRASYIHWCQLFPSTLRSRCLEYQFCKGLISQLPLLNWVKSASPSAMCTGSLRFAGVKAGEVGTCHMSCKQWLMRLFGNGSDQMRHSKSIEGIYHFENPMSRMSMAHQFMKPSWEAFPGRSFAPAFRCFSDIRWLFWQMGET